MPAIRLTSTAAILIAAILAGFGSISNNDASAARMRHATATQVSANVATRSSSTHVVVTTKHNAKLGTILAAGPKRLTVYLFEADKPRVSHCTGACASVWPPVTGKPRAAGTAISADLGTITRPDGKTQVTYKGHPLYFYIKDIKDGDAGDTYGEAIKAFGAEWYVLARSGKKVDLS